MWIFFFFLGGWGGGHYEIVLFFFFFFFLGGGGGRGGLSFLYIIVRFTVKIQNGNIFLARKFSNIFGYT